MLVFYTSETHSQIEETVQWLWLLEEDNTSSDADEVNI